jgi:3-oxoacyl-[acyl-carrier-protein] synthase II
MSRRRVLITGLGSISPIGANIGELWRSIEEGRSGIVEWTDARFEESYPAGVVKSDLRSNFRKLDLPFLDRCSQFALVAAGEALADTGLETLEPFGRRAGAFVGGARGGAKTEEDWYVRLFLEGKRDAGPFTVLAAMGNAPAAQLSIKYKIRGPVLTHASACASSGAAVTEACRAIRDGYIDIALVGGAEAPLTISMMRAWAGTKALASVCTRGVEQSCQPFSVDRSGLVLGEGAAFVVLESEDTFRTRGGERAYAELTGCGIASDAYHIASPLEDGQVAAMQEAFADAGIAEADLGYVNAHATATRGGDPIEVAALRRVLSSSAMTIPVSSTKALHGHLLGAASAIELVVTTLTVTTSVLPATAHLSRVDPECEGLMHITKPTHAARPVEHAMSNSSGLGGTNVSLIVSRTGASKTPRGV